jgi:class 3 adenylate cyclase
VASERGRGELYVTGPTVNIAARLEQAAAPGTVVIGEVTHHLVRDAVEADGPRALTLKASGTRSRRGRCRVIPGAAGLKRRLTPRW